MNKNNYDFQFFKSYKQDSKLDALCFKVSDLCNAYDEFEHTFFIDDQYEVQNDKTTPARLYYATHNFTVIGFIATYAYDSNNTEFCAFVVPKYRRQGVFKQMYKLLTNGIYGHRLHICISENDITAKQYLDKYNFEYESTECIMQISKYDYLQSSPNQNSPSVANNNRLQLPLNAELIETPNDDSTDFIYQYNGKDIGNCNIYFASQHTAVINNVLIDEQHRNKGHGKNLLSAVLNSVLNKYDNAILHVTKENVPAYKLYANLGFNVAEARTFYRKIIEKN